MYEGKLVRLRAMDNGDLNAEMEYVNDYTVMRGVTSGILYPSTVDDEARFIGGQSSYTRGEYQFAVETLDGQFLGRCGFIHIDWKNRLGEVAILIGKKDGRGKGYGTDAIQTLCAFGFDELNLHKVKVSVFDFNIAAIRCYEKSGFSREGLCKSEIFREGQYHDVVVMGLTEEQWNTSKSR